MGNKTNSNKSLVDLARGKSEKKEETISPNEERRLKAKETVEKLLDGVNIELKPQEELLTIEPTKEERNSVGWLQEQVELLSSENKLLESDLVIAKNDYAKMLEENKNVKNGVGIMDEGIIKAQVVKMFNELQSNYLAMGNNSISGEPNFRIIPIAFMNRLILFFPFLQQLKRY